MKRVAMMMAMAMLVSAGLVRAQETVAPGPASPVQGGKVIKSKTMTAAGAVKAVAADSLTITDQAGKDWTFAVDAKTKVIAKAAKERVDVGPVSPVEGGKKMPTKPAGQETADVAPVSPVEGGKVMPSNPLTIADVKEGQRVQVTYHTVSGTMHATQVRVM